MRRTRPVARWIAAAVCALWLPAVALAVVPAPDRLARAVADANKAAGRTEAIKLELSMAIGDRVDIGEGELISHPTGLARLELRGAGGLVERHLLRGTERLATRNGDRLDDARFFLPPVFLLQAESGAALRAALESFGVMVDIVGLAPCGDFDCYLLGDPARAVPRPPYPPIRGREYEDTASSTAPQRGFESSDGEPRIRFTGSATIRDDDRDDGGEVEQVQVGATIGPASPTLWIDLEGYDVRRLASRGGNRVTFGPGAVFDDLRVPSWIRIEEPGKSPVQFTVLRAAKVSAPASSFSEEWLDAPVIPASDPGAPAPAAPAPR